MLRIYLDTNVYIIGLSYPNTNSAKLLKEAAKGLFTVVQSDYLYEEVMRWFKVNKGRDWAGMARFFLLTTPKSVFVHKSEWGLFVNEYRYQITDGDDLPHICAYFAAGCNYLVTTNGRLVKMKIGGVINFYSPERFIEEVLELKGIDTPGGI